MSKLIRAILKNSIMPAAIMIASKALGLYFAVSIYNMNFDITNYIEGIFTIQINFFSAEDSLLANSFSNGFMIASGAIITFILIGKEFLRLQANSNPRTLVKVANMNLLSWIFSKESNFVQGFIWTMFLWAECLIVIVSGLNFETYTAISFCSFLILIVSAWLLVKTFEMETAKIYPNENILA